MVEKQIKRELFALLAVCLYVLAVAVPFRSLFLLVSNIGYDLGPIVQSVVSLTSSFRVISLTVLAELIYNILIFLLKKWE